MGWPERREAAESCRPELNNAAGPGDRDDFAASLAKGRGGFHTFFGSTEGIALVPRIEQIEKMLASSPDDVFLNFALAMEQVKAGRQEQAVAGFRRVIELDPDYVPAYTQLSNTLIDLGRKEEAKTVLASGVEAATRAGDKHAAGKMSDKLKLLE